jgi:recombination protein RecA
MSNDLEDLFAKAKDVAATARVSWVQKGVHRVGRHAGRIDGAAAGLTCQEAIAPVADERNDPALDRWRLDALRGRLVELSARGATATLTAAIELVLEAQQASEPAAWITLGNTTFYPPDAAASGVDLAALVVVQVRDISTAARVAERLLRSGGFGLIVLDLCSSDPDGALGGDIAVAGGELSAGTSAVVPIAHQGRLVTLAQTHDAAVVCITEKPSDAPSLGSLVSLRAEALRLHAPKDGDHGEAGERGYHLTLHALKDKRRGPGWTHHTTRRRGPPGM